MNSVIYIVAEHFEGKIRPVTYELATFARKLQQLLPASELMGIILGDEIEKMAKEITQKTGINVVALQIQDLHNYNGEIYTHALNEYLSKYSYHYVCFANTTQGLDFAPIMAVQQKLPCITGVEDIGMNENRIYVKRSLFNGKVLAKVLPKAGPVALGIQPGYFTDHNDTPDVPGSVKIESFTINSQFTRSLGLDCSRTSDDKITRAEVIISAGRGIGKKENLDLLYHLSELFNKSTVGASRPLCDLGWLGYQQQIGITGNSVAPYLYFACGISGAVQHLSGIRGARFIVSVNNDPNAAIFNMSDVCIVEDLTTFIPVLIEELEKALSPNTS